jgi:hypothetical protein
MLLPAKQDFTQAVLLDQHAVPVHQLRQRRNPTKPASAQLTWKFVFRQTAEEAGTLSFLIT